LLIDYKRVGQHGSKGIGRGEKTANFGGNRKKRYTTTAGG